MGSKIRFGTWEGTALLTSVICTQIFLNFPQFMAEGAGTAGWLLVLYVTALAFISFMIISKLYAHFEGKDLFDIAEYIGGNTGRVVVGVILTGYLLFVLPLVLRAFSENMKTISLPASPISFTTTIFIICMIIAVYMGIEAIARISAIFIPVIVGGYIFIIIAVAPHYDINNIFPILGSGSYDIFVNGMPRISIYSGLIVLFFIAPFLKTYKNFNKVGYTSLIMSSLSFLTSTLAFLMLFPYPTVLEPFLPVYQMARLINIGRFFQRIESMFLIIWAGSAFIYLSSIFFYLVYSVHRTFKLKYYRPIIFPMAILVFTISLLPKSLMSSIALENNYFRKFAWIITFALTIAVLLIGNLKKRKNNKGVCVK